MDRSSNEMAREQERQIELEMEQLVRQAKDGSARAFSMLYESVYGDLYRFAFYTMKQQQDAEDAVSEAVIKAFENIGALKKAEAFKSWMFQILVNCCRTKLKDRSLQEAAQGDGPELAEPDTGTPGADLGLSLREAFETLSDEERMIIALSVFGGYKSGEIGKQLQLPAATVRSKLRRGLHKMREFLGEEENG